MSIKRLAFCKTPELIENYELAKADNFKGWQCHHRQLHSPALKGKERSEEFSESCSLRQKGIHWYTNGSIDVHAKDCPEGFTLGRSHKPNESFKRNLSKIMSKCRWWTNGTLSKFCEVCPDGYWAGRVMKSSNKNWKRG